MTGGVVVPLVPVYPLYVYDSPNLGVGHPIIQKKLNRIPSQIIQMISANPLSADYNYPSINMLKNNDFISKIEQKTSLVNVGMDKPSTKEVSEIPNNNENNNTCNLWPNSLQFSSKAIRAIMLVANDIKDVKDYSDTVILEFYIKNVTEYAKDASFHIVLATDLRGAPVTRAIQSTIAAVDAASVASNVALKVAEEYEKKSDVPHKQLVIKSAQRAVEAANIAREIMSHVPLF